VRPNASWRLARGSVGRRVSALVLLVAVVVAGAGPGAAAGPDNSAPLGRADRVLVFSVPTLSWADLEDVKAPNITRLLSQSVVADLSVRSVTRLITATDAYATFDAGTRAKGTPFASLAFVAGKPSAANSDADGDPVEVPAEAFSTAPGEQAPDAAISAPVADQPPPVDRPARGGRDRTPMVEEFSRRTGVTPRMGEVYNFGIASMVSVNERLLYRAEIGALGTALSGAGVSRAVVANGDHGTGSGSIDFRREASVGLMDGDGLVQRGRVGRTLLREDPRAPFGMRLDNAKVAGAFQEFWTPRSVVLVEASDMVRAQDAIALSAASQQARIRRQAIEHSDELLGELLAQVDPAHDAVMLVAPYAENFANSLTVVGVRVPGVRPGLLSSGTTRRAGFVQTVDLAPTIASLMGVDVPSTMEGTVMERKSPGGGFADRRDLLVRSNDAALFRDDMIGTVSTVFVVAQLILWAAAVFVMSRPRGRGQQSVEVAALALLAYLPVTFLAGALPLNKWGAAAYWAFLVGGSLLFGLLAYLPNRRRLVDPLIVTLGFIVGLLSIDIVAGGPLEFNTVFGYTPTVAGRFSGMGNPAFSMFAAAAIMLAALLAHRIGGRKGVWCAIAVLAWAVVLDAAPFLGADVGGGLTLVPAMGVTALMLLGYRIRIRTAAIWGAAAVGLVVLLGLVDLLRPPAQRTHLGRLLANVRDNGFGAFETVVLRKLDSNLSVLASSVWTLMLPLVFAFIAYVFWRAPWRLRTIAERIPEERAAVAGLITAMVLGFALNDSGIAVPGIMLGVVSASLIHLMLRIDSDSDDRVARHVDDGGDQPSGAQSVRV